MVVGPGLSLGLGLSIYFFSFVFLFFFVLFFVSLLFFVGCVVFSCPCFLSESLGFLVGWCICSCRWTIDSNVSHSCCQYNREVAFAYLLAILVYSMYLSFNERMTPPPKVRGTTSEGTHHLHK